MASRRGLRALLPLRARTSAPPASLREGPQAPRPGGYEVKVRSQLGGTVPRLNHLIVEEAFKPGYLDPNTPIPYEPIEEDEPLKPWKVLRTRNGNLPVYTRREMARNEILDSSRYRYGGTEVTTLVLHIFGEIDAMRKDLMMAGWGGDLHHHA